MTQIDYGLMDRKLTGLPGDAYTLSATTGTVAALFANAAVMFSVRPYTISTNAKAVLLSRLRLQYTTIVAYTTPVTTPRKLGIFRAAWGSGTTAGGFAMPSANHTAVPPVKKRAGAATSILAAVAAEPEWGGVHILTTAAAGMTIGAGMVAESDPIRTINLSHLGAAGANQEFDFPFEEPIFLPRGVGLIIKNHHSAAFDAAGTWTMNVIMDWNECQTI